METSGLKTPTDFKTSDIGYLNKRLHKKVATGIYECNADCKCNNQCTNRVASRNVELKLEVFETTDRKQITQSLLFDLIAKNKKRKVASLKNH